VTQALCGLPSLNIQLRAAVCAGSMPPYRLASTEVQFGGWKLPEKEPAEQKPGEDLDGAPEAAAAAAWDDAAAVAAVEGASSKRRRKEKDRKKKKKKHKKQKKPKHKKSKGKKSKHKSSRNSSSSEEDSSSSVEGAGIASSLDSRLNPEDWFAQRLAKGYAKEERAAKRLKAKARGAGSGGESITDLRAQWGGGAMTGVKAPLNMCRSGLEG
jgi:outer membrane biosynthesis protein TonB